MAQPAPTLTLEDLPAGFLALPPEDLQKLGMTPESFAGLGKCWSAAAQLTGYSGFIDPRNFQVVVGLVFSPVSPLEAAAIHMQLASPDAAVKAFRSGPLVAARRTVLAHPGPGHLRRPVTGLHGDGDGHRSRLSVGHGGGHQRHGDRESSSRCTATGRHPPPAQPNRAGPGRQNRGRAQVGPEGPSLGAGERGPDAFPPPARGRGYRRASIHFAMTSMTSGETCDALPYSAPVACPSTGMKRWLSVGKKCASRMAGGFAASACSARS